MIIENDQLLRQFIPNTLVSVDGEMSLFDKMKVELLQTEQWLQRLVGNLDNIITWAGERGEEEQEIIKQTLAQIVAQHAFMLMIPSLDLVLTPNGFGIVSNNTIAPASKERVERLQNICEMKRDVAIEELLQHILKYEQWRASNRQCLFLKTLFRTPYSLFTTESKKHVFESFIQNLPDLIDIEHKLAENYISEEVYSTLRHNYENPNFETIIELLKNAEGRMLLNKKLFPLTLESIVQMIRTDATLAPIWESTDTAKLFQQKRFENKKTSTGYWW